MVLSNLGELKRSLINSHSAAEWSHERGNFAPKEFRNLAGLVGPHLFALLPIFKIFLLMGYHLVIEWQM